jgi:hypothetical protein
MVGKHNKVPDSKFDRKQLEMGIEDETEHTDDRKTAKNIAKDHLVADPKYYTHVKQMEKSNNYGEKKMKISERLEKMFTNEVIEEEEYNVKIPAITDTKEAEKLLTSIGLTHIGTKDDGTHVVISSPKSGDAITIRQNLDAAVTRNLNTKKQKYDAKTTTFVVTKEKK